VIAVDNAPKMVEFGSQLAKKHGFKNLEYRLGDIEDPPIAKGSVDLAIFSQALHHAIHPERAIAAAHRMLRKGGRVVVLDLLSHRFEKARELYADHWLGFSEVKLHQLLDENGFEKIEVSVVSREKETPHFQTVFARLRVERLPAAAAASGRVRIRDRKSRAAHVFHEIDLRILQIGCALWIDDDLDDVGKRVAFHD
jgi:SAM-dependent methyltransferase